jgi:acetoacetyl-CoA synthetase
MPPLWTPDPGRVRRARLTAFIENLSRQSGVTVTDYRDLHEFSIARPADFWGTMWEFGGIIGTRGERIAIDMDRMPGARFFPDARLNFAQNVLRQAGDGIALTFNGENRRHRVVSHDALRAEVARFANALRAAGIGPGDRVAGYLPNMPEAIIAALGAASVGAVWSSASPDFGVQGALDRFGQIAPRVLVTCDGYFYGGKVHDIAAKVSAAVDQLPSLEKVIVVPYLSDAPSLDGIRGACSWSDFTSGHSTSCTRPARPACRSASFTVPAAP